MKRRGHSSRTDGNSRTAMFLSGASLLPSLLLLSYWAEGSVQPLLSHSLSKNLFHPGFRNLVRFLVTKGLLDMQKVNGDCCVSKTCDEVKQEELVVQVSTKTGYSQYSWYSWCSSRVIIALRQQAVRVAGRVTEKLLCGESTHGHQHGLCKSPTHVAVAGLIRGVPVTSVADL